MGPLLTSRAMVTSEVHPKADLDAIGSVGLDSDARNVCKWDLASNGDAEKAVRLNGGPPGSRAVAAALQSTAKQT